MDAIYGGVPSQTKIGQLFYESEFCRRMDLGQDFKTSDQEAEFMNDLGRQILDAVTGSSALNGIWTWLDRPGVNRLIRLLRKARDSSFGRDE